jgi:predicted transcriptional regulator
MRDILISIHPEHANAILEGRKRYEYRTRLPLEKGGLWVIYSTAPVSAIVGCFRCAHIIEGDSMTVWDATHTRGCVSIEDFKRYFAGRPRAFAIEVTDVTPFGNSHGTKFSLQTIATAPHHSKPPQSFTYLTECQSALLAARVPFGRSLGSALGKNAKFVSDASEVRRSESRT